MTDLPYTDALNIRARLMWAPLPDDVSRDEYQALLTAGVRDALYTELDALAARRRAMKDAALEISQAADWAAINRRIRDREGYDRQHPELMRRRTA
ncbi:MAG: DUF2742 domain-containing protein [Pseudomonas sp.]